MTSRQTLALLRQFESRNVTHVEADGSWPIVWERARGVHVWDVEGHKYLDLTAAFGVMAAGHANRNVVRAGQCQMARLLHAMGDVHPHAGKAQLARELSRITFGRWLSSNLNSQFSNLKSAKTIFCNSGFEAVEAALKTALLATGRRGVVAFEGGYHGVGYGALNATHREHFRGPFRAQLGRFGHFVPFPDSPAGVARVDKRLRTLFQQHRIGAILVEPVQGRAGIRVPPPEFLPLLRAWCDRHKALLVLDEIYTGLGRTGRWFACEHCGVVPDIICLGKALAGGFPLSACVGRADIMDTAWPESSGEAIHTSTFLGHPVGCAMALAQIEELRRLKLIEKSARLGDWLRRALQSQISNLKFQIEPRGLGLMAGLELRDRDGSPATTEALSIVKRLLRRGFIVLPEGEHANVISLTPPLTITEAQLRGAVRALGEELRRSA
jgi:4-aminobutyrate aminotransferase-like enzyme